MRTPRRCPVFLIQISSSHLRHVAASNLSVPRLWTSWLGPALLREHAVDPSGANLQPTRPALKPRPLWSLEEVWSSCPLQWNHQPPVPLGWMTVFWTNRMKDTTGMGHGLSHQIPETRHTERDKGSALDFTHPNVLMSLTKLDPLAFRCSTYHQINQEGVLDTLVKKTCLNQPKMLCLRIKLV